MEICQLISLLLKYGLSKKLINEDDYFYCLNSLLDIFNLDDFSFVEVDKEMSLEEILQEMLSYAIKENVFSEGQSVAPSLNGKDLYQAAKSE